MSRSRLFRVNITEFLKGLAGAIGTGMLVSLHDIYTAKGGISNADFSPSLTVGISAGVLYIGKKLFTNSDGKLLKKEPPKP